MRSKYLAPLSGAVVALLMGSAAWADADGWYAAVDAGWQKDYSTQAESQFTKPNGVTAKWRFRTQDDWAGFARLGYRFNPNWRAEIEGGYRNGSLDYIHGNRSVQSPPADGNEPTAVCATASANDACDSPSGYANNWTVMANVIYDFFPEAQLHPFVGVGAGVDILKIKASGKYNDLPNGSGLTEPELFRVDDSSTSFAYQVLAGAAWNISDQWSLDVTWRMIHSKEKFASTALHSDSSPAGPNLQLGQFDRPYYNQSVTIGVRYAFAAPAAPRPSPTRWSARALVKTS
jgi:opacity protein-like surface antigen